MMKRLSLMAGILGVLAFLMAPPTGAQPQPPGGPESGQALQSPGGSDPGGDSDGY